MIFNFVQHVINLFNYAMLSPMKDEYVLHGVTGLTLVNGWVSRWLHVWWGWIRSWQGYILFIYKSDQNFIFKLNFFFLEFGLVGFRFCFSYLLGLSGQTKLKIINFSCSNPCWRWIFWSSTEFRVFLWLNFFQMPNTLLYICYHHHHQRLIFCQIWRERERERCM